jgi:hypothetical protein
MPPATPRQRLMGASWPPGFALVQFPNTPLMAALLAAGAGRLTGGSPHRIAVGAYYLALGWWAYEEAADGVNWFRRLLGAGTGIYVLVFAGRALQASLGS